jgi:ribosomal protein S20
MSVGSISAAGLSQYVLSAGNSTQQQALQALQNNLAAGDLDSAQSAFQNLQSVLQNSATTSGSSSANNTQLNTDLTALGSAISSGDVSSAQSAFATVLGDLKNSPSAAQTNEATAASQSLQLVENLLSTLDSSSAASANTYDTTTSILQSVYASKSGLDVLA